MAVPLPKRDAARRATSRRALDLMSDATHFHVSILGSADVARLRELLAVFGHAFGEMPTYTARQPDDAYLRGLLARDTFVAIAALADGEVIGGLAAYLLPKFEQARSELYVYDLAVAEAHRRRGIATGLLETLRTVASERGCHVIFVQADRGDAAAIALYTKLGLREDVLHFDIPPR